MSYQQEGFRKSCRPLELSSWKSHTVSRLAAVTEACYESRVHTEGQFQFTLFCRFASHSSRLRA